ncbi:hypothetical protein Tco_0965058 [Tanacetum coccineum]
MLQGEDQDCSFDIDLLTNSMNYKPVTVGNQTNKNLGIKDNVDAVNAQHYILLPFFPDSPQSSEDAIADDASKKITEEPTNEGERNGQEKERETSNKEGRQHVQDLRAELDKLLVQHKEGYANSTNRVLLGAYDDEDVGAKANLNNLEITMNVSLIPTTRIHKDHPKDQIIGDINSAIQTRRMTKISKEHVIVSYINKQRITNHKDYQNCLFACFLSQIEPKKVTQALTDPSWIEAMQDELLQFGLQKVWRLVDLPKSKHAIGTKWVYRNKKLDRERELTFFLGLQVQQKEDGIFISQDKYVADILKKFDFVTVKTASTPIEPNTALVKDEEADNIDVYLYRSMIRSLMYLTASRHDITFAVCACARFQVTPKVSHLHDVKRIFRYLKGQPKLGLRYPRDPPFDLEAFLIQTIVANSTTEAEYVAAANCCGEVLWIQNQMLDYGFNFMNTKIYIDNESTICIVKNPVFHSKTKHINIRHHFIRDFHKKKLIQHWNAHPIVALIKRKMIEMDWRCFLDEIKVNTGKAVWLDSCGVDVLLMDNGIAIHMMIEKKYPLTQEMLSRMINRRLEVDYESEIVFELLRFTRSQLKK